MLPASNARKVARQPLPAHLPREDNVIEPLDEACSACGGKLKPLGEDVSEQLELIDSAFKVIRHIRRKKACACCDHIVQAPAPSRPIERGIAGPGLLAHIFVSTFADHLPLYRQSTMYARDGVELDRSTMARWVGACGALMRPLVDALQRYVLQPGKIHSDDTPMPVLAPGNRQTKTARSGSMSATTGALVRLRRRPHGSPTHPIVRASTHSRIWPTSAAFYRRTRLRATIESMPMAACARQHAWDMLVARSMICTCAGRP